jgi:hypothetical protein
MPGFQGYTFWCMWKGSKYTYTFLFKYGSDEETLHIYAIGEIRYGDDTSGSVDK